MNLLQIIFNKLNFLIMNRFGIKMQGDLLSLAILQVVKVHMFVNNFHYGTNHSSIYIWTFVL